MSLLLRASVWALAIGVLSATSHGASMFERDVTADLGPDFFVDEANTGGGDRNGTSHFFTRDFGSLNVGSGGTSITITGVGMGVPGGGNTDGQTITATITYLGLDGVGGGGDDVVLGSESFTHDLTPPENGNIAGQYGVIFDSPITGVIDGANSIFRIGLTAANNIRMKDFGNPTLTRRKFSIAGSSTAAEIPEPQSVLLAGMAICAFAAAAMRTRLG